METDHKSAITTEVDATAPKCSKATTQTRQASRSEAEEETTKISAAYPNPAHSQVTVQAGDPIVSEREVSVFDAGGKAYRSLPVKRASEKALVITVSSLPAGIYMVRVKTTAGYRTFRFGKL
jgi:hypothetical protein